MKYAELHCHSAFSLLDGASSPEELVERASRVGLSALALTDHDDMGGMVRFAQAAKETSLKGIVGAELTLEGESHLTLLSKSLDGYKNLCWLITRARDSCERGSPRVSMEMLSRHSGGLVALSGCPQGEIPRLLARGLIDAACARARLLHEMFGEDFFLELWDHHIHQESMICRQLLELAGREAIPWVVTNNVHYAMPDKRFVHDVLTCLRHEVTLQTAGRRLRPNGSWYLKSPEEIARQWRHNLDGVKNTLLVAERCEFRLGLLKPVLPACSVPTGMDRNEFLRRLVFEGADRRYGERLTDKHIRQINHELDLITKLDLAPYFLIMWEIVQFALSQGIAVQGRGSAANSAVCYCLLITAVDPVGMDLLFERFISEGRNEPPDIDLDIAHQEREKVLQYVYNKYGREHAAMVCEHITYRGPSAVRDAARVFGFSPEQADKLSAESHFREASEAARALREGGAEAAGLDARDRRVQQFIQVVDGLNELPRHRSIHVGGFVLSGEPLGQIVPIEPASMEGRTVIQWDKDDLDLVGLIKVDLLGLGMLTVIQEGMKLIEKHRGLKVDLSQLDMNDPSIYRMLQSADTVGVFQVESRAQMNILPKLRPECFYDIVISIALVRPGPIQGNIVHPYLRRRRGLEPVEYVHPSVEPILRRTLGVPLFQEQGMRLAVTAAGFTASQADNLRRVMSHKRSQERMAEVCLELCEGMRRNGLSEEAIETITFQLRAFASYGFPESHSASFSLLVYASAYLKRYFSPEFYCAILNGQPMGFYSPATLIADALRHGVEVRSVDLSRSAWDCTLEDVEGAAPVLRIGLRYVEGLGHKARSSLEKAWRQGGAFTSLEDVCRRSGLRQQDLERLALAGAFERFCPGRRRALWEVLAVVRRKEELPLLQAFKEMQAGKQQGRVAESSLHGTDPVYRTGSEIPHAKMPLPAGSDIVDSEPRYLAVSDIAEQIPDMSALEETVADYRTLGLSVGQHPMAYYRKWLEGKDIKSCAELRQQGNGRRLAVAGGVICRQRPGTAKGFVFLTLEDESGMANVVVRPQVYERYIGIIRRNHFLVISGRLQLEEGVVNVIAEDVKALPRLSDDEALHLHAHNFH